MVSRQYERPADSDGEAAKRGERAQSYTGPAEASKAPELSADDVLKLTRRESQPGLMDGIASWVESHRKTPQAYTAGDVVAPAASQPAGQPVQAPAQQPAPNIDQRQYHINGADTEKVRQILNESMSKMTEQTAQDFRSPEL
ncbi:hypothetical protein D3C84_638140 [compost metagenome]